MCSCTEQFRLFGVPSNYAKSSISDDMSDNNALKRLQFKKRLWSQSSIFITCQLIRLRFWQRLLFQLCEMNVRSFNVLRLAKEFAINLITERACIEFITSGSKLTIHLLASFSRDNVFCSGRYTMN